jgi:phage terminase small subunit
MQTTKRFHEIWKTLTLTQRRFILAMTHSGTKRQAALSLGLSPDTVYRWPPEVNEAINLMFADIKRLAQEELAQAALRAALVKAEALNDEDPQVRQQASTEILDRVLGKARPSANTLETEDDNDIIVHYVDPY